MLDATACPEAEVGDRCAVESRKKNYDSTENLSLPQVERLAETEGADCSGRMSRNGSRSYIRLQQEVPDDEGAMIPIPTVLNILGQSLAVRDLAARLRNATGRFMEGALSEPSGMGYKSQGGDLVDAKPLMTELKNAQRRLGKLFDSEDRSPGAINARAFALNLEKHIDVFRIALVRGKAERGLGQDAVDGALMSAVEFKSEITSVMVNIDAAVANAAASFAGGDGASEHDAA